MRWGGGRRSDNVRDLRRGGAGLRFGGLGIGGTIAILGIGWLFGINPLQMLGMLESGVLPVPQQQGVAPPADDEAADFIRVVLGSTEDVWGAIFQKSGQPYQQPALILFSRMVRSGCGTASSATGPFYCPGDQKVYLDLSFFREMDQRLGGGGDFAYAYVIAHEVGHHVQQLLGVHDRVQRGGRDRQAMEGEGGLSVRTELQADCFAGVWAFHAQQQRQWLEEGDLQEALSTASAIGDDRLQQQSQGTVVPDSFTHGSSQQRMRWFREGFEGGDANRCDTFAAKSL
jgi:predicted metalloprotease